MEKDVVVFRKWRNGFGVIALFPEIPADLYGYYCESYESIGQHGRCRLSRRYSAEFPSDQ